MGYVMLLDGGLPVGNMILMPDGTLMRCPPSSRITQRRLDTGNSFEYILSANRQQLFPPGLPRELPIPLSQVRHQIWPDAVTASPFIVV